jgi:hypothetical protein
VKWWGYRSYIIEEGAVSELERSDRRLGQERMEGGGRKGEGRAKALMHDACMGR